MSDNLAPNEVLQIICFPSNIAVEAFNLTPNVLLIINWAPNLMKFGTQRIVKIVSLAPNVR